MVRISLPTGFLICLLLAGSLPAQTLPPPKVSVEAFGLYGGGETRKAVEILREQRLRTTMHPLLGYIFFENNSATIPERYSLLTRHEQERFTGRRFLKSETLEVYYELLNILGKRMADNPATSIILVGCNADSGEEQGNLDLSSHRAEAVRAYLQDIWHIPAERITTKAQNLPDQPSPRDTPDGTDENRRVEIHSDNWELLMPVITTDTTYTVTPPTIQFKLSIDAPAGVKDWILTATQGEKTLYQNINKNQPKSPYINWNINKDKNTHPISNMPIIYTLEARDMNGQSAKTPRQSLPVKQLTREVKLREKTADTTFDRYNLILFDFEQSELNAAHRKIIELIKAENRIRPGSIVTISGYSDRTGKEDINRTIAQKRAQNIATALGLSSANATIAGKTNLLYPNELPEGRFYCRTVQIDVLNIE